jgi:uncharacterized membrane protein YGL010W
MSTLPTSALMIHFKDYEQYHRNKYNKVCHYFGIPLVLFSLLGLLAQIVLWAPINGELATDALFRLDLGLILFVVGAIFAIRIDFKLAIPFAVFTFLNYLVARHLSLGWLLTIQTIGWVFQLVGHYAYEKRSPAFFTTISHLIIGPMWVFARAIGYYKP